MNGDPSKINADDENVWALLCHAAVLGAFFIPFGNIVGPLIVWMLKRKESELVDQHGKSAVNFQITLSLFVLACIIALIATFFRAFGGVSLGWVAWLLFIVLSAALILVLSLVFMIIAMVKASQGETDHYPLTIRFNQ
jgi:uncharacterized protein